METEIQKILKQGRYMLLMDSDKITAEDLQEAMDKAKAEGWVVRWIGVAWPHKP